MVAKIWRRKIRIEVDMDFKNLPHRIAKNQLATDETPDKTTVSVKDKLFFPH